MQQTNLPNQNLHKTEKGQSLVIIGAAFIAIIAFVGFAIDMGILMANHASLRRAVDASALAGAAQFREGAPFSDIQASAIDFYTLNNGPPANIIVETCENYLGASPPALCPPVGSGRAARKFVRVTAEADVSFTFLRIIGFNTSRLVASAVSEAASLDVILVIDTSASMSHDASCNDGDDDDGDGVIDDCGVGQVGATPDDYYRDPANCNPIQACHPFEEVKAAAISFVRRLNYPYDRIGIATFSLQSTFPANLPYLLQAPLSNAPADLANLESIISSLQVSEDPACSWTQFGDNPGGCTSTSIGGGLKMANYALTHPRDPNQGPLTWNTQLVREEALWVAVLLTDGAANASEASSDGTSINMHCPASTWDALPFCRRANTLINRHSIGDLDYDADDFARDQADSLGFIADRGGQDVIIYTIGLGNQVTSGNYGLANAGEALLRYAAAVGDDGDPLTDPCDSIAIGQNCGNYYFAPTATELDDIFRLIAENIFTRISE